MFKINLILLACLGGIFTVTGCSVPPPETPVETIRPVMSLNNPEIAKNWFFKWANQQDIADKTVKDMVFLSSTKGRNWRQPDGPDGCLLRMILLDADGKPVFEPGTIRAFLVKNPHRNDASVVAGWQLDIKQCETYFDDTQFSGFVLPLDWGDGPGRGGLMMIVIRWENADGNARFTRNSVFEDTIVSQTSTYSRPVGNAGGGTGNSAGNSGTAGETR